MQQDSITLFSISKSDLQALIKSAVSEVLEQSKNTAKEKELLNAEQICELLGISLSTLNVWKRENKIPFKRLGKRIFFQKSEVMNALEESNYSRFKELGA